MSIFDNTDFAGSTIVEKIFWKVKLSRGKFKDFVVLS